MCGMFRENQRQSEEERFEKSLTKHRLPDRRNHLHLLQVSSGADKKLISEL